jgi:hypothetical protein
LGVRRRGKPFELVVFELLVLLSHYVLDLSAPELPSSPRLL